MGDKTGTTLNTIDKMADILQHIFLNEDHCSFIQISLIFVAKGPIGNNPVLVQLMAWCSTGDKSYGVTRPQ